MKHLDELRDWCAGETAVVICGGISAVAELHRSNWDGAHLVSVNQHGLIIPDVSFVYAHDKQMVEWLKKQGMPAPIMSPQFDLLRDHDIYAGICPWVKLSGPEAVWSCGWLGFKEIWLIGVDAYQAPNRDYWHQYIDENKDYPRLKKRHNVNDFQRWKEIKERMEHPERVRCFHKNLQEIFSQ